MENTVVAKKTKSIVRCSDLDTRSLSYGDFTLDTLVSMSASTKASTLGMYVYELVLTADLAERKRRFKTLCAEALLHMRTVPGCNQATKDSSYLYYKKSEPSIPWSRCVKEVTKRKHSACVFTPSSPFVALSLLGNAPLSSSEIVQVKQSRRRKRKANHIMAAATVPENILSSERSLPSAETRRYVRRKLSK